MGEGMSAIGARGIGLGERPPPSPLLSTRHLRSGPGSGNAGRFHRLCWRHFSWIECGGSRTSLPELRLLLLTVPYSTITSASRPFGFCAARGILQGAHGFDIELWGDFVYDQ